jgi:hypothetical protein
MSKPIKFMLEFSGYANLRVDGEGSFRRPPTADELAAAIETQFVQQFQQCDPQSKMRVTIKRVH